MTSVRIPVYAIVRLDDGVPLVDAFTVKEVVSNQEQADKEVRRLNHLNSSRGARYFWQATRLLPEPAPVNHTS